MVSGAIRATQVSGTVGGWDDDMGIRRLTWCQGQKEGVMVLRDRLQALLGSNNTTLIHSSKHTGSLHIYYAFNMQTRCSQ